MFVLLVAVAALVACGGETTQPTPTPVPTVVVQPTDIPNPSPVGTPVPAPIPCKRVGHGVGPNGPIWQGDCSGANCRNNSDGTFSGDCVTR